MGKECETCKEKKKCVVIEKIKLLKPFSMDQIKALTTLGLSDLAR